MCVVVLTTVGTAPGFCTRSALTTWKTSTTPSVLHLSMVVAMAQNIPDLLTVSLHTTTHTHMHSNTRKREREGEIGG